MPQRSNDFQAVIYFVRSHLDTDATVTESAMLPDRTGAGLREVDVLITSQVGGRRLRIGVECRDHRKPSDVTWVEQVCTKQADLELDQMVLVSSTGFSKGAVAKARYHGIQLVTPEQPIAADGPLGRLRQFDLMFAELIRDRLVAVSGQIQHNGELRTISLAAGAAVFNAEGEPVASVAELVADLMDRADLREVVRQASSQATGQGIELRMEVDNVVLRPCGDGDTVKAFIQMRARPGQLLRLTGLSAVIEARVQTRPVSLSAGQLQGTAYSVGAGQVAGDRALVVFSGVPEGERIAVRLTDADGQVTDWIADRATQTLQPHRPAEPDVS